MIGNITREYIEQLSDIEPYCFETDREEWWFNIGLKHGLEAADAHPKFQWISVEDDLPCNHEELIHFGFTNNVLVIDDKQNTSIAFMKKYKDNEWIWDSTNDFVFLPLITHWMPIPKLSKE